jgi:hypothetical protein
VALDVDLGRDLDELDVEHAHACIGQALLGFAHQGLASHKAVPGRRGRDRDETKPYELKAGPRRELYASFIRIRAFRFTVRRPVWLVGLPG